jgi:type IV pilus assembly protein PilA
MSARDGVDTLNGGQESAAGSVSKQEVNIMKMFHRKDEGFTLVELMVVVLIIGILVAIAIPVFNAASASARQRTCQSNMRTIEGAVEQYLASSPSNTRATCAGTGWVAVLVPGYIKDSPTCPSGAGTYPYTVSAGTTTSIGSANCPVAGSGHVHF